MHSAELRPQERNKFLTLHHELLYPAFAGAALVEFAEKLVNEGITFEAAHLLWMASALWFLLYFSVAFLGLAEADEPETRGEFGPRAFTANLAEIGVILWVSLRIVSFDTANLPHLRYWLIYLSWILIVLTGGMSNYFSARAVRGALSIGAMVVGALGLIALLVGWLRRGNPETALNSCYYLAALAIMYVLLGLYFRAVFGGKAFLKRLDFKRKPA
jgi:hypothetical protein